MPDTTENTTTGYQVLARKYRPETFADLVGQDVMVRTLKNAFEADRIAQAFILTGIRGTGKTTTARIIAKGLNCIGEDGKGGPTTDPCGTCEQCHRDHRRPPCRCDGNGRRIAHRCRRHPGNYRLGALPRPPQPATRYTSSTKFTCCQPMRSTPC